MQLMTARRGVPRTTLSAKAGIVFPAARVHRKLKEGSTTKQRVSPSSAGESASQTHNTHCSHSSTSLPCSCPRVPHCGGFGSVRKCSSTGGQGSNHTSTPVIGSRQRQRVRTSLHRGLCLVDSGTRLLRLLPSQHIIIAQGGTSQFQLQFLPNNPVDSLLASAIYTSRTHRPSQGARVEA